MGSSKPFFIIRSNIKIELDSFKYLALEVIVTLAENATDMVKEKPAKYIPLIGKYLFFVPYSTNFGGNK